MRRLILLVTVFLLVGVSARAQNPKVEVFGGYSYASLDEKGFPTLLSDRVNANGWGASLSVNLSSLFGITFDVANQFGTAKIFFPTTDPDFRSFQFLVGPRFTLRAAGATGFVHLLLGAASNRLSSFTNLRGPTFRTRPARTATEFALATGGGLDVRLSPLVAVRTFQVDYIPSHPDIFSGVAKNLRVQTGIVLRF